MFVWITNGDPRHDSRRRYHLLPHCYQLQNGVRRHGTTDIVAIPYELSFPLKPCSACTGQYQPLYFKPYCHLCETWRPCLHNGGVMVKTQVGISWVWPDQVDRHEALPTRE